MGQKVGERKGKDITLTDRMKFAVGKNEYASYAEAIDAIDRAEKTAEAMKRKKLNIPVLDEKGVARTVTGIHAGHGKLVLSPAPDHYGYGGYRVYPVVPWISEAIAKAMALREEAELIESATESFSVYYSKPYGEHFDHEATCAKFEAAVKRAESAATATTLDKALSKHGPCIAVQAA